MAWSCSTQPRFFVTSCWRRSISVLGLLLPTLGAASAHAGDVGKLAGEPLRIDVTVAPAPSVEPAAFQLGLSADGYTALRAWLEAGPPMDWRVET